MRWAIFALGAALATTACSEPAPHPFPEAARARFEASCPAESAVCACTWDRITRTVSYEDYEAALQRFRETGLMEPRITRARTQCLERHRE